jgi:hypothetical protein
MTEINQKNLRFCVGPCFGYTLLQKNSCPFDKGVIYMLHKVDAPFYGVRTTTPRFPKVLCISVSYAPQIDVGFLNNFLHAYLPSITLKKLCRRIEAG